MAMGHARASWQVKDLRTTNSCAAILSEEGHSLKGAFLGGC